MKLQPAQMASNQCAAVGTIWWNELLTPSTRELSDFYSRVVGWKRKQVHVTDQKSAAENQKDEYTIFMNGNREIAGIMNHDHTDAINPKSVGCFIYIQVADLATAVEKAEDEGGTILQEPIKIVDDNRVAVIRDPLGNVFGIVQPANC